MAIRVKDHKTPVWSSSERAYISLGLWTGVTFLLWHLALVITTGLPIQRVDVTIQALIKGLVSFFALTPKPGSAVGVHGNPDSAWVAPVVVWAVLVLLLQAARVGLSFGKTAWRQRRRQKKEDELGLATAAELRARVKGGNAPALAPAVFLLAGVPIHTRAEDTGCVFAPPRWGKTMYLVAPMVAEAPGSVITTSTRPDVLRLTAGIRAKLDGNIYVADFDGLSNWPTKLRWHMVGGCADSQVAEELAAAMVSARPKKGDEGRSAGHFEDGCRAILKALLHAADLKDGGSMRDVVAWSQDFDDEEPANIIRQASPDVKSWATELDNWCRKDNPETIGNTRTTLARIMAPMLKESVLEMLCSSSFDAGINIATFTDRPNTLYCLVRTSMTTSTSPIVTALVERITQYAIRRSGATLSGRLALYMSLILDEAPNTCALPSLPSLMTEGGGNGIHTWVFAQAPAQLRSRWGDDGETIFDSASAKCIFGGLTDEKFLQKISTLIGQHWVEHGSASSTLTQGGDMTTNTNTQLQLDAKLRADQLRKIGEGTMLLMYREIEAIVDIVPVWERPDRHLFEASKQWVLAQEGITDQEAEDQAEILDETEPLSEAS